MDHAGTVRVLERVEYLRDERDGSGHGHRSTLDQLLEGFSLEVLHHHQEILTVARKLVDGTDASVIELGEHHRFATKPFHRVLIDEVGVQQFQCDAAIQRFVDRFVDGAHAASTDLLDHAVLADRLPNHFTVMIPARQGCVKNLEANSSTHQRAIYSECFSADSAHKHSMSACDQLADSRQEVQGRRGVSMRGCGLSNGALAVGALLICSSVATAADAPRQVTFSKDVAPIFQAKCQDCHQPNSIAPMSLITFQDARPWARSIKERVSTHQMPPWHIDRSVGVQKFKNDVSLTAEQSGTTVKR